MGSPKQSLTPPYRCALGRVQPTTTDLEAIKRRGWQEDQILVIKASDARLDFVEPKSGSYPVAGSAAGGFGGPMTGAMRSLT